mgnify:CR=1 FL=1
MSVYRQDEPATLIANREHFGNHVYTPLDQVVEAFLCW